MGRRRGWNESGRQAPAAHPPALGYGADGTPDGTIPPNSNLIFDVQLLGVQ